MAKIKNNLIRVLFVFGFLLLPSFAFSLSCLQTSLLQMIDEKTVIVVAKVLEQEGQESLRLLVHDVLNGDVKKESALSVEAKSFLYWSFNNYKFDPDSLWVFKLYPRNKPEIGFSISPCDALIKVEDAKVKGFFTQLNKEEVYTIEQLKKIIKDLTKKP